MKFGEKLNKTTIQCNCSYEAESLEIKLRKVLTAKEPIDNTAPLVYTERKDGVQPQYDIRTDRWEIAQNAMGEVAKSFIAERDNKPNVEQQKTEEK